MSEIAPRCPDCGAATLRKPVRRGPRTGLEFWSCSNWPDCRGAINIDPDVSASAEVALATRPPDAGVPGAYNQRRHEQERARGLLRRRAALPLIVALSIMTMTAVFFGAQPFGVRIASLASVLVGAGFAVALLRLPFESLVWAKGAEGERRAAAYVEPLLDAGFIVLNNRRIPGGRGDIDHIVIGPTGIFPIETKNWSGRVEIRNDRLFVGSHDRTWVLEQVYREALAVQLALGEELTARRVTVVPIICALGGVSGSQRVASGVHVTDGRSLARLVSDRPHVFDDESVQQLARLADDRIRVRYEWEPA